MKRMRYVIVSVIVLSLAMPGAVWAAESKEERTLENESVAINKTAGNLQGEKVVTGRLEKEFNVTDAQVQGLRSQKLGYGEISIVLSLASNLPGGATEANIQQVITLRQGPPRQGWGEVAKKLGTKLGTVVSRLKAMDRDMHQDMKSAKGGKEHGEQYQEGHGGQHNEIMGHAGIDSGPGMSHVKGR
jgi:hypothetical protein